MWNDMENMECKESWNVKWYLKYRRKASQIVKRYGNYRRKVSGMLKRYRNYGREASWNSEKIWKIQKKSK